MRSLSVICLKICFRDQFHPKLVMYIRKSTEFLCPNYNPVTVSFKWPILETQEGHQLLRQWFFKSLQQCSLFRFSLKCDETGIGLYHQCSNIVFPKVLTLIINIRLRNIYDLFRCENACKSLVFLLNCFSFCYYFWWSKVIFNIKGNKLRISVNTITLLFTVIMLHP